MLTVEQLAQLDFFKCSNIISIISLNNGLSHRLYQLTYIDSNNVTHDCVLRYLQTSIHAEEYSANPVSIEPSSIERSSIKCSDIVTNGYSVIEKNYGVNEYKVMQQVYNLGIGPNVIDFVDVSSQVGKSCSLIIMDFIDATLASNMMLNDRHIDQLAHYLESLHNVNITNIKSPSSPNSLALLDHYWSTFNDKGTNNTNRFNTIKNTLKDIKFTNDCLIHGDLNFSNILINKDKMTWIDWEYASIGDAYFDYATLCVESVDDIEDRLIKSLASNVGNPIYVDQQRLQLFKLYYAAACWLWTPNINAQLYIEHSDHYQLILEQLLLDMV